MFDSTICAPQPSEERARLAEPRSLDILDTPADQYFDRHAHLMSEIFKVPMAADDALVFLGSWPQAT